MYLELGSAVFAGLAVLAVSLPLNVVSAGIARKYQFKQMASKDIRAKLMNEILSGIKVIKLYGWEASFMDQVLNIR